MQSGRLLKGSVTRSPNGYVVEHSAGRLVIPYEEVRVIGDSLADAYRRLRESFQEPTAATHYDLARWCWTHHLPDEARSELVMALDRDPDHEAARDLLERIDEHLAAARKKALPKASETRIVGGVEPLEVESLAGLSRETAARYTSRVQPLLINKCGNASCHGPKSSRDFRLESPRGSGPGHRMYSERNLAAVMEQIDLQRPDRSRLLKVLDENHGGMNRALFYGPAGDRQVQLLRDWVHAVAKEKGGPRPLDVAQGPAAGPEPAESRLQSVPPRQETAEPSPDDAELRTDLFDPEAFNRRHHSGGSGKPSRK
jgi:hypothetical protein